MAARTRKIKHDAETRAKIKTSQLVNMLTAHALGDVEMSATQVKAIEVLLRKTLPDLTSVEGKIENEVTQRVVSGEPLTDAEWEHRYANGHSDGSGLGTTAGAAKSTH